MIQIGTSIVSLDIFDRHFVCDLAKCRGMCCVCGESGAPLEDSETGILEKIYPKVKKYMTRAGIAAVEKYGVYDTDWDSDRVTPLIGKSEDCAYSFKENGIVYCAVEKAFINGEIDFRKPVSCHLYPIRITRCGDFEAVNYHNWDICKNTAEKTGTPLYIFLKEPLTRKYGSKWYGELCMTAIELDNFRKKKNAEK